MNKKQLSIDIIKQWLSDSEWDFLQEMVDLSARLDDFVEVANGYTYTAGNGDMFWIVKGE